MNSTEVIRRSVNIDTFAFDDEQRQFEGYANVFDIIDSYGTTFAKGSFQKELSRKKAFSLLYQHSHNSAVDILGLFMGLEDEKGLYIKGEFFSDAASEKVYQLVKKGALDSLSVGVMVNTSENVELDGKMIRKFTDVSLFEVSIVHVPANKESLITTVRQEEPTERDLERALRDAGLSISKSKKGVSLLKPLLREAEEEKQDITPELINKFYSEIRGKLNNE